MLGSSGWAGACGWLSCCLSLSLRYESVLRQAYSYTYFGDQAGGRRQAECLELPSPVSAWQEWHCLRCPDDECAAGFELVLSASLSPDSWQQLGLFWIFGGTERSECRAF